MMNVQISINTRTYNGDDVTDNYSTTIPTDIDIRLAEGIINAIIKDVWGTHPEERTGAGNTVFHSERNNAVLVTISANYATCNYSFAVTGYELPIVTQRIISFE